MASSITVPMTTVAFSEANSSTVRPTSENSPREMSVPAAMLTNTPRAPVKSISSSNGERIADSAASLARSSPLALPLPIMAIPISDITVRTSAKSTLIIPGLIMRSAIPCTAPDKTSSTEPNASSKGVFSPRMVSNFSLGIVINESTYWDSSTMPSSAIRILFFPSNKKGLVTTATVRIPISLAISATIGAAPVPVPPPIPAVMNTISEPARHSAIRSRSSSAASLPIEGLAPAPRPRVMPEPSWSSVLAPRFLSACASVLAQINSTPWISCLTICSTALPPPPPTPITLMTAFSGALSTISNIVNLLRLRSFL